MSTKLLLCTILAILAFGNVSMADKLPDQKTLSRLIVGKWYGDKSCVLTFSSDGSYAIDSTDDTMHIEHAKGRWHIKDGQLLIDWNDGSHSANRIEYMRANQFATEGRHHHNVFDRVKN